MNWRGKAKISVILALALPLWLSYTQFIKISKTLNSCHMKFYFQVGYAEVELVLISLVAFEANSVWEH